MKVFIFCLFIFINISNNGKASLESFAPMATNLLFEDTTKNTDRSCHRPCKFNVKPRRCQYKINIEPSIMEDGTPALTMNGLIPGPPIVACVNDIIIVEVTNRIPGQDLAIHWASSPGTFFYHADSVTHQSDGLYGSLIVNQPQPLEAHSNLYDYDRSEETTVLIAAKFDHFITGNLEDLSRLKPYSLIVNGNEESSKFFVLPDYAYRLRLINAIAIECPIVMSIDKHDVVIIATDGEPVKPVSTRKVQLYPGERMDVVVRADQPSNGYWIRISGQGVCGGLSSKSMLIYSGFNYTSMLQNQDEKLQDTELDENTPALNGQALESIRDDSFSSDIKSIYLSIDRKKPVKEENDFRYISDAIPKKAYYPAPLFLQDKGVVQINEKSFLYPNAPILLKPREIKDNLICNVGDESKQLEIQCIQTVEAVVGDMLEIALINEGNGSDESYTFHMHGFGMKVLATGHSQDGNPLTKEKFIQLDKEGKLMRNLQSPPIKDTISVPNKGFVIVRIKLNRGGSWLLECRACSVSSLPTAVLINVPQALPTSIVDSLPKCGSYRPPDVLLN
ncbi:uncharacterized protein LOC101739043 isoform X2 [Bombyx mori]|uniref:Uncharacterized protein n=1 Tax=Bombyx mori TaxID=7091 RepID=A0A8R2QYS2_BOMMO|nr:laccase-2 isoform X2 [Bombyx mori]